MISWTTVLFAVVLSFSASSYAQNGQYAVQYPPAVNFTELFSKEILGPEIWAKEDWSGVTSFAGARPVRCLGSDANVKYDVAVLGNYPPLLSTVSL